MKPPTPATNNYDERAEANGDGAPPRRGRRRGEWGRRARFIGGEMRRRGRLVAGLAVVVSFYAVALLATFFAPYDPREQLRSEPLAPATVLRFVDAEGRLHARPFVYARRLVDPLSRTYAEETSRRFPVSLFARGPRHRLLGLFETDRHLFGVEPNAEDSPAPLSSTSTVSPSSSPAARSSSAASSPSANVPRVSLLGTDELGRDRLSRLLVASRFSLLVGPVGTVLASLLGVFVGCVSGYAGRKTDAVLMRAADAMMALPALVLILAARAAFPPDLPPTRAAALMISLFVALGWAEMARLARGLVLELRAREFVLAARSIGMTEARVLFRHILPNAARPLVVQASLMLPAFLLAETALSYLGVGVQDPAASWGSLLSAAATLAHLRAHPFLLLSPAIAISLFVLGVRLLSDGLKGERAGE